MLLMLVNSIVVVSIHRVVKVFAMGVITRDFTMFLRAGKNTFGHGNKW